MSENLFGKLSVIGMRGCDGFVASVDYYLKELQKERHKEKPNEEPLPTEDYTNIIKPTFDRFSSGEAKCVLNESMRGHDIYIISDCFNYGETYRMYGVEQRMSPDDHFADLKRTIGAIGGKAKRINVIMPMLYEGRQHKRMARESLDCATALQELETMGVKNIITFDAHDHRVSNAIPLTGFDNVRPTYQMIKALVRNIPDIPLTAEETMIIAPDEGAMSRTMYFASVMGIELGMFYKRRNYSVVVNGKNPIEAHEYLGKDVKGKDVIIVDDMIASGDSILDVSQQLKQKGARRIFLFVTFGMFTEGLEKFDRAYEEGTITRCFITNLTYHKSELAGREWYVDVNMCKYVALLIDTMHHDQSISTLLNPTEKIHKILNEHAENLHKPLPFEE